MKLGALRIAIIYFIVSIVWIALSDRLLFGFKNGLSSNSFLLISSGKGIAFVFVNGLLLYKLIRLDNNKIIENEKQYRDIYQSNPNPMWIYDPDSLKFISVNDAAVLNYGYSRAEFLNMTILDIRPAEDRQRARDFVKNGTYQDQAPSIWPHIKKDGTQIYVNVNSHKIVFNNKPQLMATARDHTDKVLFEQQLKAVNEELEKEKRKLSQTQRIAGVAGWEYDIAAKQVTWSAEVYAILKADPGSGKSSVEANSDYIHPDDRQPAFEAFAKLLADGQPLDIIHRIITHDNEVKYIRQLASLECQNDEPLMIVGSMQDITELKLLELERNNYLYNLDNSINNMTEMFFAMNHQMEITKVNDKMLGALHMERRDLAGKKLPEAFPNAQMAFSNVYEKILQERTAVKIDGYSPIMGKWLRLAGYPTEEGAAIYLTDMSEEKRKDLQLREALERYDFVAEATKDVIYDYDVTNNRLNYNTSVTELIHVALADVGTTIEWWRDLIHPDDVAEVTASQQKVISENGNNWECEYRVKQPDGSYKYVSDKGHFLFDEVNNPTRLIGSIKDIDALKRSNEENKRLAGIITRINNMVVVMDNEQRVQWVNKAFEEFTGYKLDDVSGKRHGSFMQGPDTSAAAIEIIAQKQNNLESFAIDLLKYKKSGEPFWVSMEFTPTFDRKNQHTGYIGVYQDITQRKHSQEALQRQNSILREVAWLSSHEVRRPAASIMGLINLMKSAESAAEKEEMLALIDICVHELDSIIHDINDKIHDEMNIGQRL